MFRLKGLKFFGIVLGLAAILMSLVVFSADVGSYESNKSYGGDAYTGMQQASAQAANNVLYTGEMLQIGVGSILALHGCVLFFGSLCIKSSKKEPKVPVATGVESTEG